MKKDEMAYSLIQFYPFNLFLAILEIKKDSDEIDKIFYCNLSGLMETLDTLKERENDVIKARFANKLTYQVIGDTITYTSRERVRQILKKSLKKLRHPSRMCRFYCSSHCSQTEIEQEPEIEQDPNTIAALTERVLILERENLELIKGGLPQIPQECRHVLSLPVECLGLTARSYNCLMGADCRSVGDIMREFTPGDESESIFDKLIKVRNMGSKSAVEIMQKLIELGLLTAAELGISILSHFEQSARIKMYLQIESSGVNIQGKKVKCG